MWKSVALLASALLATTGSACSAPGDAGLQVVAGFYPLQYVAQRIAGDRVEVTNLTAPGVEPHDAELSPRQVADVHAADVLVTMSGFQPAVDAAARDTDVRVVDPSAADFETRSASEIRSEDPHFWLDPRLMADLGDAVALSLGDADPAGADDYLANASSLRADLQKIDLEYDEGLAECRISTVVVSHDAFGYLDRYGLDFESIAGLSPDAEPSARHLGELAELIRADDVTTVFSERLASPRFADTLAADLGIRTAVLDPIEGPGQTGSEQDYLSLMRENLAALRRAGGCT